MTAIEKLVQDINKLTGLKIAMDEPCVEQAEKKHEQQIIDFAYQISNDMAYGSKKVIEEMYNKTFKNTEK